MFTAVVVFPTPPFWFATHMTRRRPGRGMVISPLGFRISTARLASCARGGSSISRDTSASVILAPVLYLEPIRASPHWFCHAPTRHTVRSGHTVRNRHHTTRSTHVADDSTAASTSPGHSRNARGPPDPANPPHASTREHPSPHQHWHDVRPHGEARRHRAGTGPPTAAQHTRRPVFRPAASIHTDVRPD